MISKPLVKLDNQVFDHVMYPPTYTLAENKHTPSTINEKSYCSMSSAAVGPKILIMINNYARVAMISKLHGARYATSEAGESRESEFFVLHTTFSPPPPTNIFSTTLR